MMASGDCHEAAGQELGRASIERERLAKPETLFLVR
jgi:hypothetical protein